MSICVNQFSRPILTWIHLLQVTTTMSSNLSDLERRLNRLNGTSDEASLQHRLNQLQPETLTSHTHQSLTARFASIFGSSDLPVSTSSNNDEVEAYLTAAAQGDWSDEDDDSSGNNTQLNMAQQAFMGSGGGEDADAVSALLSEAQDAIRMSASVAHHTTNMIPDDENDDDEDAAVLAIINASKDELLLASKFGVTDDAADHKKTHKKKKRNDSSSSESSDSESSETSSNDDSSDYSSDEERRRKKRKRTKNKKKKKKIKRNKTKSQKEKSSTNSDTLIQETPYSLFKKEELETLNRLREAARNEGEESELVRLLATRLVQLRKSEKQRLRQEVRMQKLNNYQRK